MTCQRWSGHSHPRQRGAAALLVGLLALAACSNSKAPSDSTATATDFTSAASDSGMTGGAISDLRTATISMRFTDSSVPPQFHRDWAARVADRTLLIEAKTYNATIAAATFQLSNADFEAMTTLANEIAASKPGTTAMCPGGTSNQLTITRVGTVVLDAFEHSCTDAKRRAELLDAFGSLLVGRVGDFSTWSRRGDSPSEIPTVAGTLN